MSDGLAHYIFLPYLRRGMAQYIVNTDDIALSPDGHRTELNVAITVDGKDPITKDIRLYGPGDVTGIDTRMIVRTDPTFKAVVGDYEPNFLPIVEFSQADLPWCMTPAVSAGDARLRPWMCLIVLKACDPQSASGNGNEV